MRYFVLTNGSLLLQCKNAFQARWTSKMPQMWQVRLRCRRAGRRWTEMAQNVFQVRWVNKNIIQYRNGKNVGESFSLLVRNKSINLKTGCFATWKRREENARCNIFLARARNTVLCFTTVLVRFKILFMRKMFFLAITVWCVVIRTNEFLESTYLR